MKSIPTAAIEELLNLTPLDVLIMAEARMTFCRLHIYKQTTDLKSDVGMLSIWKIVGTPHWICGLTTLLQFMTSPRHLKSLLTRTIGESKIPSFLSIF
jgi:hypothetical protein